MNPDLFLPSYLSPMPETDPRYASLNQSAYEYALGSPGEGNLEEFQIVIFEESHDVYRLYGGPATECGYWWVMAPDENCYSAQPAITKEEYMEDIFAICPTWNSGSSVIRSQVPAGSAFVVGIGQTATCEDGSTLVPSPTILQLNGDVCGLNSNYTAFCEADPNDLQASSCVEVCDLGVRALTGSANILDPVSSGTCHQAPVLMSLVAAMLLSNWL